MMFYGGHSGSWGWVFTALFWLVVVALPVTVAFVLPRRGAAHQPAADLSAAEILDRRFALGEIDVEAYRAARARLAEAGRSR